MSMTTAPMPHWNDSPRDFSIRHDAAILRGPVEWSWDVTNECTGACLHCFNRSGVLKRDELTDEEMDNLKARTATARAVLKQYLPGLDNWDANHLEGYINTWGADAAAQTLCVPRDEFLRAMGEKP